LALDLVCRRDPCSIAVIFEIIFLQISLTKQRIAKYKKTGGFIDLLRIFSRY